MVGMGKQFRFNKTCIRIINVYRGMGGSVEVYTTYINLDEFSIIRFIRFFFHNYI